jgi:hypothetical protein
VRASIPARQVIIALEPGGQLYAPENFGYRCTLVDAAAVLNYYGVQIPQALLAERIGLQVDYSIAEGGVPWWVYVGWPGHRPSLDTAVERVARDAGRRVVVHTDVGLDFQQAATAITHQHPVILNVLRAPNGTSNHSLLAYGLDTRGGRSLLLVIDPNTGQSNWVGGNTLWSQTVTSTYIVPLGSAAPAPAV